MKKIVGRVESVYVGSLAGELAKQSCPSLLAELDGFNGDRHRSFSREAWESGDKQAPGTIRRNERHWSAVSVEELADISKSMGLTTPLTADVLGANICFKGIPDLSLLPKGSIIKFPSGAELMVEEYNPPCSDMGEQIAATFSSQSGAPLAKSAFSEAAKFTRGVVGVVEVAGVISAGDVVIVEYYEPPIWQVRLAGKNSR